MELRCTTIFASLYQQKPLADIQKDPQSDQRAFGILFLLGDCHDKPRLLGIVIWFVHSGEDSQIFIQLMDHVIDNRR
jgi:hypothetical protein